MLTKTSQNEHVVFDLAGARTEKKAPIERFMSGITNPFLSSQFWALSKKVLFAQPWTVSVQKWALLAGFGWES